MPKEEGGPLTFIAERLLLRLPFVNIMYLSSGMLWHPKWKLVTAERCNGDQDGIVPCAISVLSLFAWLERTSYEHRFERKHSYKSGHSPGSHAHEPHLFPLKDCIIDIPNTVPKRPCQLRVWPLCLEQEPVWGEKVSSGCFHVLPLTHHSRVRQVCDSRLSLAISY